MISAFHVMYSLYCVDAGLLVDHRDNDLMSAFRVQMHEQNKKKQTRLKVSDETLMLPMDNSFSVGTASTCSSWSNYIKNI